jgi:peptidyl-prolyl cis-trans isomerase D
MLKQLREKTKTILWIVVVAFVISIFAVWGMNLRTPESRKRDRDVVGSVNGEIVTREAYVNTYNELFEQMRMQKGEDYQPSEAEYRMIADQAWERVVQKILVAKEIEKRGIVVTDNELVTFLRRTPPPIVQQAFVNDEGQFDYQAYLAELSNPARDWTRLEQWARAQIPEMKLQNSLAAQVHVPENDVLEAFKKETIKVKATYVAVPIEPEEPPFEPAEHEVAELYEQVKDDYLEFEKRRIRVIQIDKKPSEEDELDVRGRLQEIMDEILAGADFAEAAGKYSDDYMSAENGGELGFISKGVMVPEFEEAAFALETGEISEPVRTEFGYHLIKVEERKTEEEEEQIKVRHILMKVDLGYDTVDSLRTVLDELFEEIKEKGFERAAARVGGARSPSIRARLLHSGSRIPTAHHQLCIQLQAGRYQLFTRNRKGRFHCKDHRGNTGKLHADGIDSRTTRRTDTEGAGGRENPHDSRNDAAGSANRRGSRIGRPHAGHRGTGNAPFRGGRIGSGYRC